VRVFVDYWNLTLTMQSREEFRFDWERFPMWLASAGAEICGQPSASYEGAHVYASYNPSSDRDQRFKDWLLDWLDRQPGVQVNLKARRRRNPPSCPACHETVAQCPACGRDFAGTQEKGIDTAIVTDMIRLAWERAYDIAVLVTSDSDFVPAVEFLDHRGLKTVQAGFPPTGAALAKACWASFDLFERREQFRRR
jgi:uncharacterized LabA/DUF88 family protein